jgi:hypothetical protein
MRVIRLGFTHGPWTGIFAAFVLIGCGKDPAPRAEPAAQSQPESAQTNSPKDPAKDVQTNTSRVDAPPAPADPAKPADAPTAANPAVAAKSPTPGTTSTAAPTPAATEIAPSAPSAAPTPVVAATSAAPEAPPPPPVESPKQTAQFFSVWLQTSGRYTAGQQGQVEAVVVPKGEFHCNNDYPYKFVTSAGSSGVTYPKATVRSDGLSVSPTRAVMRVPFVPANAGDAKVGGTFHFSVCSDSQCVVEKRDVFVTVKVQ